jgi:integrase
VLPRARYIEDWEVGETLALVPKRKSGSVLMLQAYIRLKMLIGIRRGDMPRLRMSEITDAGIMVRPHNTTNSSRLARTFEWTPALRAAVDMALAARPIDIAPWLFCTKRGECYLDEQSGQATGWDSIWQRFMARLLAETKIKYRFTEHGLRVKCASDAEILERARQLLGHADATNHSTRISPKAGSDPPAALNRVRFRCISCETDAHLLRWLPHDGDMKSIARLSTKEHAMTS